MPIIEWKELTFGYEKKILLKNISGKIEEGECVALVGPSGCGKSTLCYLLSGIIPRSIEGEYEGEIKLLGENLKDISLENVVKTIGVVFQNPDSQLFSPTVEDELAFGPENFCLSISEIENRIDYALKEVDMESYRFANPTQLSGGQKQLIALAAVLVMKPKLLIFDEALSQLDKESTDRISDVIIKLKNEGKSIIMVEHDMENLSFADRILCIEDGKLIEKEKGSMQKKEGYNE